MEVSNGGFSVFFIILFEFEFEIIFLELLNFGFIL